MIGAILVTINILFAGVFLTYFFQLKMWLEQRIAAGLLLGLILLSYVSFTLAHFWGMNGGNLVATLLLINLAALVVLRRNTLKLFLEDLGDFKQRFYKKSWQIFGGITLAFIITFGYLVSQLMTYQEGNYFVQPVHAYGDISLHLGIISSFVYGNNFPPQNPNFSGTPISYPFMVDFLTAFFVQPIGLPVEQAMAFTGVILFSALIILLIYFVMSLSNSKKAAVIALSLFLFNGGFGFVYFWQDWVLSEKSLMDFLWSLPKDYTAIKDLGYWWINVNLSMLLPQRSFLYGFGVSLLILSIFLQLKKNFQFKPYILVIGLLALLPLIHAHSLVALSFFVLYFLFFILKNLKKERILFFLIGLNGLVIAYLLSKMFLAQSGNLLSLFSFQIGWMSGQESLIRFYIKNFGIVLFVLPVAFYFVRKQSEVFRLGLVSLIWFFLPSMMSFQPWDFDNIKLFIYWYFFASIVSAVFFVEFLKRNIFYKAGVVGFILVMTLAGFLDIFRIVTASGTKYPIYGPESIAMAEFIKQNLPANAVFVSADKFDNPVVSLAGRKVVMGFTPWLWTYGLDYSPRSTVVTKTLAGDVDTTFMKQLGVTHVVLFPQIQNYSQNQQFFDATYQLIYDQDGYRIYKL